MSTTHKLIKQRIDLREFMSRYGIESMREYTCCPVCDDKHFKAKINDENIYCYHCSKAYDVFDIMCHLEGIEHKDALKRLAAELGIAYKTNPFQVGPTKNIQEVYVETLWSTEGHAHLDYLRSRGFTDEEIGHHGFGCVPKDIDPELKELYDNRRMVAMDYRISIPLRSNTGYLLSYKYRSLSPAAKLKYMYVKSYKPSLNLHHFFPLKHNEAKLCVLVEGEFDAAMVASRACHAACIGGCHVDIKMIRTLKRQGFDWIGLCLDYDKREKQRQFVLDHIYESGLFAIYTPIDQDPCSWLSENPELLRYQLSTNPNNFNILRRKVGDAYRNLEMRY